MGEFPRIALSVRQPWAWAIINAGKDIENRSWQAVNHGLRRRGRIAVHASKSMTRHEYESAKSFMASIGVECPMPDRLKLGQIIGSVEVVDVVSESASQWFFGPRGLVLRYPKPVNLPMHVNGQLGYFEWTTTDQPVTAPRPWMVSWPDTHHRSRKRSDRGADLFDSRSTQ